MPPAFVFDAQQFHGVVNIDIELETKF